jgi:hypothetical protein
LTIDEKEPEGAAMTAGNGIVVRLGAWLIVAAAAHAAGAQSAEKGDPIFDPLDARVKQFLEEVSMGNTAAAYKQLLAGSPLSRQAEAVQSLVDKTGRLKTEHGEYRSFERISGKRVGEDVVVLAYLYKCEHFPVVWRVTFYRAPSRGSGGAESAGPWRVIAVRFDGEVEPLAR